MTPKFIALSLAAVLATPLFAQNRIGEGSVTELYAQYCAACHGQNMEGGLGSSLIDDVWAHGSADSDIAKAIREGVAGSAMIAWGETLTDQEIRSMVIYMREQKHLVESSGVLEKVKPLGGVFSTRQHNFRLENVASFDNLTWALGFLPDQSMLVTQRDGTLWNIRDGVKHAIVGTPIPYNKGQAGLLEVAAHPDYEENGWIYLAYSDEGGILADDKTTAMTAIVRGRIKNDKWVDEEVIFKAAPEYYVTNNGHFGVRFVFKNGYIFFSIGERQHSDMAQDLSVPNGKIHRIFDDGRIPDDNPFLDTPGAYPSIWSYGHRNPQGLDENPLTGELWSTEHGPRGGDELNLIQPGLNYGWPLITYGMQYNGQPWTDKTAMSGMEQPVHYWVPSIATGGIDFYEGDAFPDWKYDLLITGMSAQQLIRMTIEGGRVVEMETILQQQGRVRDVVTGPDGLIYLGLNGRGEEKGGVYRLVPVSEPRWTSLFNGRDLDGWKLRNGPTSIVVDDGAIVAFNQNTENWPYLLTEKSYRDFILELEIKVLGSLNSGILIRGTSAPEIRNGRTHGMQVEIDQSERQWTGGIYEEGGRKWLYSLEGKTAAQAAYRPSNWNHYRIEAIGEHYRVWVNDVPVLNMVDDRTADGVIGFQIHKLNSAGNGGSVSIRNIRIIDENAGDHINGIAIPERVLAEAKAE